MRLVYFLCSRLNYYYPFLDHVIQHMNDRFPEALKGALQGTLLIPSNLRKLSTSVEEAIKKEFAEDLPMPQSFEHEVSFVLVGKPFPTKLSAHITISSSLGAE